MKKRLFQFALMIGLMTLFCVAAQAAETSEPASGFRVVAVESAYANDVTLTPVDADNKEVAAADVRYPGAVKMNISYSKATAASEYLLCVLKDDGSATVTPTADNMAYIDQKPAEGTTSGATVEFAAFPKKPEANETSVKYAVYLSSNADAAAGGISSFTKVATFEYYGQAAVLLGDVDGNGRITSADALDALYLSVNLVRNANRPEAEQRLAADVDANGSISSMDALNILYASVNIKRGVAALDAYIDSQLQS